MAGVLSKYFCTQYHGMCFDAIGPAVRSFIPAV
jgi:hypothetical protein